MFFLIWWNPKLIWQPVCGNKLFNDLTFSHFKSFIPVYIEFSSFDQLNSVMLCSPCRSDKLDHLDSLTFPDYARPSWTNRHIYQFFSTTSRSQTLIYADLYASFTRPQLDQLDLCSIAARSSRDQIGLQSDITRVEVGMIGYRSGKKINPTKANKPDRYTNASGSTWSSTRPIHDCFSGASRPLGYSIASRICLTCQKYSSR